MRVGVTIRITLGSGLGSGLFVMRAKDQGEVTTPLRKYNMLKHPDYSTVSTRFRFGFGLVLRPGSGSGSGSRSGSGLWPRAVSVAFGL